MVSGLSVEQRFWLSGFLAGEAGGLVVEGAPAGGEFKSRARRFR